MGRNVLAFDFGASSGRAMLGSFDGKKISIREVHRFQNEPVWLGGAFVWDFPRLLRELETGLRAAHGQGGFDCLGIDTWGVDYGLLDGNGELMGDIRHYRDPRNMKAARSLLAELPMEELYARTGVQFAPINTIFQLRAAQERQPWLLENASRLLMLPDLFGYFLTGLLHTDYTAASTTGLLDLRTGGWDFELIGRLGLPSRIFGGITAPGARVGPLRRSLCDEWMIPQAQVISVASHDTASAVAAAPVPEGGAAYVSCGTWSLFGTELSAPNNSAEALAANFTNEGGYGGKIRFLKNIMGLWLIQESRRHWNKEGPSRSFAELEELAGRVQPFRSFIDVEDEVFSPPGDLPGRVRAECIRSGQPAPDSVGEVMQCVYGSIALRYRYALERMSAITGRTFDALHIVGGGIKDQTLMRLAADACGVPVVAGPAEATVIGNVAVQLISMGEIGSLSQARAVIRESFPVAVYEPGRSADAANAAYMQYKKLFCL